MSFKSELQSISGERFQAAVQEALNLSKIMKKYPNKVSSIATKFREYPIFIEFCNTMVGVMNSRDERAKVNIAGMEIMLRTFLVLAEDELVSSESLTRAEE